MYILDPKYPETLLIQSTDTKKNIWGGVMIMFYDLILYIYTVI